MRTDVGGQAILPQYFEQTCDRRQDALAVICGSRHLTYAELDHRANRLARLLLERGVEEASPVGILLERSLDTYVALLGVIKAGAAYVPLDPSFPPDRLGFIAQDAGLRDLVTTSGLRGQTGALGCPVLELDQAAAHLAAQPADRPEISTAPSSACYIIYTSGSTGKPKGVAISHASIVNFLRVATPIYGVQSADRVYQGMSISFDFHIEEIWPAWVAGATLIAGPNDSRRFGQGLTKFLTEHEITVFCSVPTLLTTIEDDPPSVRHLLVSGEPMPADLVRRWSRPGRRILNCYGPTETTVSSSCCELLPNRPVTLGIPFPTYRFYILDAQLRPVPEGGVGEICIGGPGVGIGYLNRPELTTERFLPNPISSDRAAVPRIYRTGDLGRFLPSGEVEYLGRMDTQVKIRGYRIELGEIEQVIREDQAVENAVVTPLDREGVVQDLVGYVTLLGDAASVNGELRERLHAALRRRLPTYMIPSFIEVLDRFPMLAADKVDRAALPPPASPPLGAHAGPHIPAETALEADLADVWGEMLSLDEVSVEDDFFCDLGGHSLTAARVISCLRQKPQMHGLAMGDLYAHPTIRSLARFVETELAVPADCRPAAAAGPAPRKHSTARVLCCGIAQLAALYSWMLVWAVPWVALLYVLLIWTSAPASKLGAGIGNAAHNLSTPELATFVVIWTVFWFGVTAFLLPAVGGRLLMHGVRPGRYPLWGITYLRFWFYGRIIGLAPLTLLTGTPLLPPFLRLLGAKVGRDCHLSAVVSLPFLVEIGDGASIGYGVRVQPYAVEGGWLRLAPVRIGARSFLGANSVVLAGAEIGSDASVGEQSLVSADQVIPANEHWAGSPIRRLETTPALLDAMATRADGRRWPASVLMGFLSAVPLLLLMGLLALAPSVALVVMVTLHAGLAWGVASTLLAGPLYVLVTCTVTIVAKRIVLPTARTGIYPWRSGFGVRKWMVDHMMAASLAFTRTLYATLYLVPFLRRLGARTGRWSEVAAIAYLDPDMTVVGEQSFLAENIVMSPPVFHRGCVALARSDVGRRSFVGNGAFVPGSCQLGDNSLIGVHSVAPARSIEPETTWLGSPVIFLPRRQQSERFPDDLTYVPRRSLIVWRLVIEFFRVTLPATIMLAALLLDSYVTIRLSTVLSAPVLVTVMPALALGTGLALTLLVVILKWLIIGRYRPRVEPLWNIWTRRTELITGLYETVAVPALVNMLTGTPWIAPLLRLFGVRVGRRVWLGTTWLTEFDLVEIGDDVAVGEASPLQTHLFEDRVMKMSRVKVGSGSSIGSRSVVLYDSEVGAGACLDALSLVMKGERLPADSRWRGIPARPL